MISIIIPVFNHEPELTRALRSILGQTYRDWEIIIVDDGSAIPVSQARIKELGLRNTQVIRQENRGAPAARNAGIPFARGEYVIFWDADVIADPKCLEKMYKALQSDKKASYAYADFYMGFKKMHAQTFDADALKQRNYIHSTSLLRKDAVVTWDESLKRFQDWDLWLTLLSAGKTGVYIPEALFHVLHHKGGMSSWLPRFAYSIPFRLLPYIRSRVLAYEAAKKIIQKKHGL